MHFPDFLSGSALPIFSLLGPLVPGLENVVPPIQFLSWSSWQRKTNAPALPPPTLSERVGLIPSIDLWGPELLAKAIIPDLLGSTRFKSFPDSSVGKESACNAEDPSLIPGSGRSTGEGIGYPPQYSWASLVAKLVNNPPTMWETWVRSLGWEDLLEKGKATHFSILTWRISWTLWSMGSQRVKHNWATFIH